MRVGFFYLLSHVLLLDHTAADCYNHVLSRFLGVDERADVAENAHLGVLANRAGVDKRHVGFKFVLSEHVSHAAEHSAQPLAVRLVLLAAVGIHIGFRRRGEQAVSRRYFVHYINLALKFVFRCFHAFQGKFLRSHNSTLF
jgi:hypothetical protein